MKKTNKSILLIAAMSMVILSISGCGREKPRTGDDRIAAEVNNYKMTVGDFNDEARFTMIGGLSDKDAGAMKENILDEIITKKIMVQEAQKGNFDKNRAFMKEIERYWEQALLKLLYKKKFEELSRTVEVSDKEVMSEYEALAASGALDPAAQPYGMMREELRSDVRNKKLEKAIGEWVNELKAKARIKKYTEVLKE